MPTIGNRNLTARCHDSRCLLLIPTGTVRVPYFAIAALLHETCPALHISQVSLTSKQNVTVDYPGNESKKQ